MRVGNTIGTVALRFPAAAPQASTAGTAYEFPSPRTVAPCRGTDRTRLRPIRD